MIPAATLADLIADPKKVAELPAEVRSQLVLHCAALIAAAARPITALDTPAGSAVTVAAETLPEEDPLLTVSEAAKLLNFAESYVYELARKGSLPVVRHKKYVRIQLSDLRAWIARHRQQGTNLLLNIVLSETHDGRRGAAASPALEAQANRARRAARRAPDHGEPVGAGDREDS
jgi:excisionase family DNA binding protein